MKRSVIVSAVRTPVGGLLGDLSSLKATTLGGIAIKNAVQQAGIKPETVEYCIMGNVLPAGLGQAPARQAVYEAELPNSVQALTINKVCGSGLKAVMIADQMIRAGDYEIVVAGGMESMSNAPYVLPKARSGYRMGNGTLIDSMINDGLWDVYSNQHMGVCADIGSAEYGFTRKEQDDFAAESYRRAIKATEEGLLKDEIIPVEIPQRKGDPKIIDKDEGVFKVKFEKIPKLKPAFTPNGQVTAANASSINDGAAAFVVMSEEKAKELGLKPLVVITGHTGHSHDSVYFTTAPAGAMKKLFTKLDLTANDVDLYEINEAFSFVTLYAMREFNIPHNKVNVHGGAAAIGHPIGASGARILVTLIHALKQREQKRGLATLCIGGGESVAMMVERP